MKGKLFITKTEKVKRYGGKKVQRCRGAEVQKV